MAIDQPLDAYQQQDMPDESTLPNKLAKFAGETGFKLAFPQAGLAADILLKVVNVLSEKDGYNKRFNDLFERIKKEFEHVETTKADHEDVKQAILRAFWNDLQERNDAKRDRYVKLICHPNSHRYIPKGRQAPSEPDKTKSCGDDRRDATTKCLARHFRWTFHRKASGS